MREERTNSKTCEMKIRLTVKKLLTCKHIRNNTPKAPHYFYTCTHDPTRQWTINVGISYIHAIRVTLDKSYKFATTFVVEDNINHSWNSNGKGYFCANKHSSTGAAAGTLDGVITAAFISIGDTKGTKLFALGRYSR